jgi:hypothetical protein
MNKIDLRLAISAIAICGVAISTARGADLKPSIGQQFIDGHHAVSFSIVVPSTEDAKRVENVKVACDKGECRVRVVSISQRACETVPVNEMIQINDYGPEENDAAFRPKVTAGDDGILIVHFIDSGQEARLRVLLRWDKSVLPTHKPFIASGGVVGEEEVVLSQPARFAPISEIVGSPIICHARFQSR